MWLVEEDFPNHVKSLSCVVVVYFLVLVYSLLGFAFVVVYSTVISCYEVACMLVWYIYVTDYSEGKGFNIHAA